MKYALRCLLLLILLLAALVGSPAQLQTLRTRDMQLIYYSVHHSYIVPHLGRAFENSLAFHRKIFNYEPSEEVVVFLQDFDDYGYAGATSVPRNYMILGIEPYDYAYETSPTNERFNWVMSHELVHVVASDRAASSDRFFRSLFLGKVNPNQDHPISMLYGYLTTPRKYSPRWYHEGIAVFMETWMSGGIGRALSSYDEMTFRAMVRDSAYFYDIVGLESEGTTIDFQVGANSYLYGTRFLSYLAFRHGPEKLLRWFTRTDSTSAYFSTEFEHVYATSLDDEWSRWIEFEHGWQRANLDSIRSFPVTPARPIVPKPLGAASRGFVDTTSRSLLVAVNNPGQIAHIASIRLDGGETESVCDVLTPALYYVCSMAYDASDRRIFYTTDNTRGWRDLNVVNLEDGASRRLIQDARIGDLVFHPLDKSIWGIQHNSGISTLVRIPPPYSGWSDVLPLPYGRDMFDLDISPDGKHLSSTLVEISGRQLLVMMDLDSLTLGIVRYDTLYEFENNSPQSFVFSPDGTHLFGTTSYTGVSNVVRYDLAHRTMAWITNGETGYFHPIPVSSDSLITYMYTGKGFVPVMIANRPLEDVKAIQYLGQAVVEKYPQLKSWKIKPPSPENVNIDSLTIYKGEYNPLGSLELANVYPVVEGYKNDVSVGLFAHVTDPFLLHDLEMSVSYSLRRGIPDDERFHAAVNYQYTQWKVSGSYNGASFYDLFGPTKASRKGYSLSVGYADILMSERPKTLEYSITAAGYGGLEVLPEFQNVPTSFDKFLTLNGKLQYSFTLRSLGAVDAEKGVKAGVYSANTYVRSTVFPRIYAKIDYGILLPIDHSSIWLRAAGGHAFGDRNDPFGNFYFGGFGNNWVDHQDVRRYRNYDAFPGEELNAVGGPNFAKGMVEWMLPPVRFRRFGIPGLYCNWAQLALFSSAIMTSLDRAEDQRRVVDVGAQLDWKIVLFSNLESTLSLGFAVAAEENTNPSREFMVSLKILR